MNHAITANNLTKMFRMRGNKNLLTGLWRPDWKYKTAVDDVGFAVNFGESVAFLGPNGAGKTTTTKMMTGLIAPTTGSVEVLGTIPFDRDQDFLRQIGLVMGNKAGLNWDLTARQSFWLLQNIYHIPRAQFDKRVHELTTLLEVENHLDTQVRRLSLGERMKLELIGAIIHEPRILFLDEPTIGLDIIAKKNIRTFLRKLQQDEGITLVLTSHDMDDVEEVCDRVLVINHGKKVYDDCLALLVDEYKSTRYVRFVFEHVPTAEKLAKYGEIVQSDETSVLLQVSTPDMVKAIAKVAAAFRPIDMHVESVPLEEIIEHIFKEDS